MLIKPTIAKLQALGLAAMATVLANQAATPGPWDERSFEDRLGLLVDREADARDSRRLATRSSAAKRRYRAAVEDIHFGSPRGLKRAVVLDLAGAGWVTHHHNLVVTGPTGVGKSFLACALANAALRQGHTALYARRPDVRGGARTTGIRCPTVVGRPQLQARAQRLRLPRDVCVPLPSARQQAGSSGRGETLDGYHYNEAEMTITIQKV